MIELARAKPELGSVRFAVADGGRLPYPDATFDLAVSLLVQPFEHELHRVLAPGGWALFCYPMGPGTPIWFPTALVAPRLERARFAEVRSGVIGPGEWDRSPGNAWASRGERSSPWGRAGRASARLAVCVSPERDGRRLATTSSRLASRSRSRRAA